jgi:N-acetylglucosaminyldiphosphoundecaprenol N-acetyl-beta-D-mannosaminyltransferase
VKDGKDGPLLPRASLADVVRGRAPLVGSRLDPSAPRGWVSPVEARVHLGLPTADLVEEERRILAGARRPLSDAALLGRALLSHGLAGGGAPVRRPFIVAAPVDNLTVDDALAALFEEAPARGRMVHFVHAHALNVATFDPSLRELYDRADLVLGDGIGLRLGGRLLGVAMRANLNGTDLLPLLCREAAARDVPLALVGGAEGVAEECAENLRRASPGLRTPVVSHGYLDDAAAADVAERIGRLGRAVALVGMGTPLQERWAWRHLAGRPGLTVLTVGGLFDFFSGRVRRAPVAWREIGLEWAWRIKEEPRRLARRYLVGNPLFLSLAALQRLRGRSQ